MTISPKYNFSEAEPRLEAFWQENGIFHFDPESVAPIFSIDTPPPTVSGNLHLGHVYSYSHADFIARYWRMRGYNVFYPMGYDDNGLPTERLVERRLGISADQVGRGAFIEACLKASDEAVKDYERLWKRLGFSVDWRYTYRTIDNYSRKIAQASFIDLYRKNLAYRQEAPAIWCPECHTSLAQADLNDLEQMSEFLILVFQSAEAEGRPGRDGLPIATTRPELLPACVAVFVNPKDERYLHWVGRQVIVPLFNQRVPVIADLAADPAKGSGAVMCCTFGDVTDVNWWYTHKLPLIEAIDSNGCLAQTAGEFAGLPLLQARKRVKAALEYKGLLTGVKASNQSVRVHERCDTPVEYVIASQWFIRVLDHRQELIAAGDKINWHPEYMKARYRSWVENLNWDWCISRQRIYGVPFPVWYCESCGEVILAEEHQLPVDPAILQPVSACKCGSSSFRPERDVMDTWATSSLTPQIVGKWQVEDGLYAKVFPFSLRPHAHEIIRTWTFYTILKSLYHYDALPWKDVLISGWGIAGEGMGKISKSRGGGTMPPLEMIERYSADAVRYWTASTSPGKDSIISEEKIRNGGKLITKLWNVARFSETFILNYTPPIESPPLSPADQWILSRTQRLVQRVTTALESYDYAVAKNEIEIFFWQGLADNYLEMCKQRLYYPAVTYEGARFTLYHVLLILLKLFAPFLPYVTETIYLGLFAAREGSTSIHRSSWPKITPNWINESVESLGQYIVDIATAVRRYKSEKNLSLGSELAELRLCLVGEGMRQISEGLQAAFDDLKSVTRARKIIIHDSLEPASETYQANEMISISIP